MQDTIKANVTTVIDLLRKEKLDYNDASVVEKLCHILEGPLSETLASCTNAGELLSFGKYKSMSYATVFKINPGYFLWLQGWENLKPATKALIDAFIEDVKSKGLELPQKKRKI